MSHDSNTAAERRPLGPRIVSLLPAGIEGAKARARGGNDRYGFRQRLRHATPQQLVDAFNGDRKVTAWVTARGFFHAALRDALLATDLDCSSFITESDMSLAAPLEIVGNAIQPLRRAEET